MPRTISSFRSAALCVAAIGFVSATVAQTPTPPMAMAKTAMTAAPVTTNAMRASEMKGKNVIGAQGKKVGEIEDLVLNISTGEVRYALMAFDPGFFKSEKVFAVPVTQLSRGKDDKTLVYSDTSRAQLEKAGLDKADWKKAADNSRYLQNADVAYGFKPPAGTERSFLASKLVGMDVKSRAGKDIGDIKDVVVDMPTGRIAYLVLAFDPSWMTAEKLYAFPSTAFHMMADKGDVMLDVDKSMVAAMKSFDANRWSSLNDLNRSDFVNTPVMVKKP